MLQPRLTKVEPVPQMKLQLFYETGEVKIIDFGTSKIKSIVEQETTLPFYSQNF